METFQIYCTVGTIQPFSTPSQESLCSFRTLREMYKVRINFSYQTIRAEFYSGVYIKTVPSV